MFRDSHMCGTWPPPPAQELIRNWVILVSPGVSSGLATGAPAGSSGFCGPLSSVVEKAMAPPLQYSCLGNPMDRGDW